MDWLLVVLALVPPQVQPIGVYPFATEKDCRAVLAETVKGVKQELPKDFLYVAACLPVKKAPGKSTGV